MTEKNTMTVKEIAEKIGVSKTTIQNRLTDDFRKKYVIESAVGNRKILRIKFDGCKKLEEQFENKKKADDNSEDDVIQILKKQLAEKDQQIEKLQILLSQSQQLQLAQNDKIKKLEIESKKMQKKEPKKKSFWQRIFG